MGEGEGTMGSHPGHIASYLYASSRFVLAGGCPLLILQESWSVAK